MKLKTTIDDTNTTPTPAIAAALAARPYRASEARVRNATCAIKPTSGGLEITAQVSLPSTGAREVVVIEPGTAGIWMSETDVTRQGRTLTAVGDMAAESGGAFLVDRSAVKITVIGDNSAVEIQGCAAK